MTNARSLSLHAAIAYLALLLLAPLGGAQAADAPQGSDKGKAVIVINGDTLTDQDVNAFARAVSASRGQPVSQREIMNTLIDRELLYQEALAKGYDKQPDVRHELENRRRSFLANVTARQILRATPVKEEELHKFYEDRVLSRKLNEYKARHILVKSEGEAKDIIAQLDKGDDFSELAKSKSTDPGSAKNGGDLGWFGPNQMVPEFSQATAALTKGHYTKTPVKSRFGWHVILLDDSRPIPPPKFEDIKQQLQGAVQKEHIASYLSELRKKAKIEQPK